MQLEAAQIRWFSWNQALVQAKPQSLVKPEPALLHLEQAQIRSGQRDLAPVQFEPVRTSWFSLNQALVQLEPHPIRW